MKNFYINIENKEKKNKNDSNASTHLFQVFRKIP